MKKYLYLLLFCLITSLCQAQTNEMSLLVGSTDKSFAIKLVQFLVNYPDEVWEGTLADTVKISFDLNAAGTLSNAKIIKDIGSGCAQDVKNVLTTMLPPWTSDEYREKRSVEMHIIFDKKTAEYYQSAAIKEEISAFFGKKKAPINEGEEDSYTIGEVDVPPCYGDCSRDAPLKFAMTNLKYPATARENNMQGRVITSFIIEKDGSLSNFKSLSNIGGGSEEEVIRCLKLMNNWMPGKRDGKPVRVKYTTTVTLKLAE